MEAHAWMVGEQVVRVVAEEIMVESSSTEFVPEEALGHLSGDVGTLWHDPTARRRALDDLLVAWESQDTNALRDAVDRIDSAIVAGLRAVGMPRGPIDGITIDVFGRGWRGRKVSTCRLLLDALSVARCVRTYQAPDDVFRTWLHESIHARQPFAPSFREESRVAAGYEEGLAEGLARRLMRARPGMRPIEHTYGRYVVAYETLAACLAHAPDVLWRRLWSVPAGAVRQAFLSVVDDLWLATTGRRLSARQRILVGSRADVVFSTTHALTREIDAEQLADEWERTLR